MGVCGWGPPSPERAPHARRPPAPPRRRCGGCAEGTKPSVGNTRTVGTPPNPRSVGGGRQSAHAHTQWREVATVCARRPLGGAACGAHYDMMELFAPRTSHAVNGGGVRGVPLACGCPLGGAAPTANTPPPLRVRGTQWGGLPLIARPQRGRAWDFALSVGGGPHT